MDGQQEKKSDPGPASEVGEVEGLEVSAPRCPFCHEDVAPGDPAKRGCNLCMAWHHTACWSEQRGCAVCSRPVQSTTEPAESGWVGQRLARLSMGLLLLASLLAGVFMAARGISQDRSPSASARPNGDQDYADAPPWAKAEQVWTIRDHWTPSYYRHRVVKVVSVQGKVRTQLLEPEPSSPGVYDFTHNGAWRVQYRAKRVGQEELTVDGVTILCDLYRQPAGDGKPEMTFALAVHPNTGALTFPGLVRVVQGVTVQAEIVSVDMPED